MQATVNANLRCRGARASCTTLRSCWVYLGDMTRNSKKVPSIAISRRGLDLIGTEPGPARDLPWHGVKTLQHLSNKFCEFWPSSFSNNSRNHETRTRQMQAVRRLLQLLYKQGKLLSARRFLFTDEKVIHKFWRNQTMSLLNLTCTTI